MVNRRHHARGGSLLALALLAASALVGPADARAQDAAVSAPDEATTLEARTLFEEGVRLSRAERWLEALDAFRRSRQLVERPRTLFNQAIALDRLGRLRESLATIDRYLAISDATADDADRREAARMRLSCERRLVTLSLHLSPTSASIEIDGEEVQGEGAERRFTWDPGDHVLVVRADGHAALRETLSLPPGSLVDRSVTLTATATGDVAPTEGGVDALPTHDVPPDGSALLDPSGGIEAPHEGSLVEDPIFWIVLGAVAVGVGVGVGVGVYVATEPQPYGGTTGLRF